MRGCSWPTTQPPNQHHTRHGEGICVGSCDWEVWADSLDCQCVDAWLLVDFGKWHIGMVYVVHHTRRLSATACLQDKYFSAASYTDCQTDTQARSCAVLWFWSCAVTLHILCVRFIIRFFTSSIHYLAHYLLPLLYCAYQHLTLGGG
jgi:hypothetical protein